MKNQEQWVDLVATVGYEQKRFNQKQFEEMVGDKFVAVKVSAEGEPQLIWTEKFVCPVKFETYEGDLPVMVLSRNP